MSKQNFDSEELVKLFHKIHQRLDWLTCAIKECCSKIPINIGDGVGLFKRLANNKWEFKSLVEGDNITITETTTDIIISSNSSGFTCSDLDTCSTTNLAEGTRFYFTNERAVQALTEQNISLFTNDVGYLTNSSLTPYLTINDAEQEYYSITNPDNFISGITNTDVTSALGYTPYRDSNPDNFITSSALSQYLTSSLAALTYQPIGSYLTTINGLNISLLNNDSNYITSSALSTYAPINNPIFTGTVGGITKTMVGLGNVDNTSDLSKPISTATQTALDLKADKTAINLIIGSYNSGASLTSVTVERKLASIYVAGETYTTNDNMKIEALLTKIGGNGILTYRIRVSTEEEPAVITSATLLATAGGTAGNMWFPFRRYNIHIESNSASICHTPSSSVTDDITALTVVSSVAINHTVGQWYHITGQLGSGIDVVNLKKYIIYK